MSTVTAPLTKQDFLQLKPGDVIIDEFNKRWKVNGKIRTWKTMPNRIYVPLKHGLYSYDHLDETDFNEDGTCHYSFHKEV